MKIKVIDFDYDFEDNGNPATLHAIERNKRFEAYKPFLSFNFVECFIVDKNHKNGNEIHCINENGLIYIYNQKTKKLITVLHARGDQLRRYYWNLGYEVPQNIEYLAEDCDYRNKIDKYNTK